MKRRMERKKLIENAIFCLQENVRRVIKRKLCCKCLICCQKH